MSSATMEALNEQEFLAQITDIAYQSVLRRGIVKPFPEVELGIWREICQAFAERKLKFKRNEP